MSTAPLDSPDPSLRVVRVPIHRAEDAMSALLGAGPSAGTRFVRQAQAAGIALDRIWSVADEADRFRATVLAVKSPGRTSMLLASHPKDPNDARQIGRAVETACLACAEDCDLAQALLEPTRPLDAALFEVGGLTRLATLDYLECTLGRAWRSPSHAAGAAPAGYDIAPIAARVDGADASCLAGATREELVAVLEGSYLDTLDCPALAGVRRTHDVLDGHFGSGARTRVWLVAREGAEPRGVCLLNGSADRASAELVYLGITREARGKGLARALLTEGMRRCASASMRTVTLAVDARNTPARRLYDTLGFVRTQSRLAMIRPLRAMRSS